MGGRSPSDEAKTVGLAKKELAERFGFRKQWWTQLIERSAKVNKLHAHITPGKYSWIGTGSGVRGSNFNYTVKQTQCGAELYIDRGNDSNDENQSIFDQLKRHQSAIEKTFGSKLNWEHLEGKRACRISCRFNNGGYRSPEEKWPKIQNEVINAMDKLEKAIKPHLKHLKLDT